MVRISSDTTATLFEGKIHISSRKHIPIVISAEDEYRKGIVIDICSYCGHVRVIVLNEGDKQYCNGCASRMMEDRNKQNGSI